VKEVVWKGADADVTKLPILRHQELDSGKYITSAVFILRDPKTGVQNAGIYRSMLHGKQEVGFMTGAFQGGNYILVEHRERKQPMQVAMVIGHHPCLLLAGTTNPPGMGGELEVAGGDFGKRTGHRAPVWSAVHVRVQAHADAVEKRLGANRDGKVPFGQSSRDELREDARKRHRYLVTGHRCGRSRGVGLPPRGEGRRPPPMPALAPRRWPGAEPRFFRTSQGTNRGMSGESSSSAFSSPSISW